MASNQHIATVSPQSQSLPWPASINSDRRAVQIWVAAGTQSTAGWESALGDASPGLPQLLVLAEAESEPAATEKLMAAVGILSGLPSQKATGMDAANALRIFEMGMDDVPEDLLIKSVRIAARACTFRLSPAELRALIADDLAERSLRLARLRKAVEGGR